MAAKPKARARIGWARGSGDERGPKRSRALGDSFLHFGGWLTQRLGRR